MKAKHLVLIFTLCIVSFVLPYNNSGTAEEEEEGPCLKPYIKTIFPVAGKPGDQLKIRGRRFGTEKGEVIFTTEAKAEIVEWIMHRIWVIVPTSAASGPVVVRVPCGSESNKLYFTVKE
jgi:hypothetical protein